MKPGSQKSSGLRQKPLVTTKLRPPANRGALIERPHLLEVLNRTLSCKLALVHGPAGFGKTTLAAQWFERLKASKVGAAWLAVDSSDNDVNRFLAYLVEAVRVAEPDIGTGLRDVIEANPHSAADFVIDTLVNDFSLHDGEFVLFIDDWHLIQEAQVHNTLQLLLSRMPANLHLVITSRARTGVPISRLRVQDELVEIDTTDLRFDFEESKAYLSLAKSVTLSAEDLLALWRSTEGWAAALHLASISLRESGDHERILQWTAGGSNDIGEYLAENVINSLPPERVAFMLKTSVLERLSADLCVAVTGAKDSAAQLEALEQQELFLLPIDEEGRWYRYHHLFARFLQRRLKRQLPELIPSLHRAASEWFSTHGQTSEALDHALESGDTRRAVDLVERDAMALVENSSMSTLLNLVSRLPRTQLFDRPKLQMAIAWANSLTHRPQESEEALWHVERVASSAPLAHRELLFGEANVVRACTSVYADRIDGIEAQVRPCLDHANEFPPWAVGVAANVLAYRRIHTHQFEKVGPLLSWARDYQDRAQGLFSGVYGRCFGGIAAYRAGDLDLARKSFVDAMELAARTAGKQSNSARLASALMGQLLYEANELDEAERLLKESRFLGFEGGVVDFYLATYVCSSRLATHRGEQTEAAAILQEGEDTARALMLDRLGVAVASERVRLKLATGNIRGAEQTLADLDGRRYSSGTVPFRSSDEIQSYIDLAKARLLCARGNPSAAIALIRAQIESSVQCGWKTQEISARILLSLALELDGKAVEAEQTLMQSINDGAPRGMVRSFLDEGPRLIAILDRVRDKARRRPVDDAPSFSFNSSAQRLLTTSRDPREGLPWTSDSQARGAELTPRETEVLRLLDHGRANKEIARTMHISVDTVKWYLKNIFVKLGVSTRTQALNETRRLNIFSSEG